MWKTILLLGIAVSLGCNKKKEQAEDLQATYTVCSEINDSFKTLEEHTYNDTGYPCQFSFPDTSVYGIFIHDSKSAINKIGETYNLVENHQDMLHVSYFSNDKQQVLTLFFHYGGVKHRFAEFEIRMAEAADSLKVLPAKEFVTGNGFKLGKPAKDVLKYLDTCYKVDTTHGNAVYKFKINDYSNSDFLNRYNMPEYYAEFEFRKNILIRYRFGFTYP